MAGKMGKHRHRRSNRLRTGRGVSLTRRQRVQIRIRKLKIPNPLLILEVFVFLFLLFIMTLFVHPVEAKGTESVNIDKTEGAVLSIDFVGDIMLGRNIGIIGEDSGYDAIFSGISSYWDQSDLVFANLECSVLKSDPSDYEEQEKNIHLYCDYTSLQAARSEGINVFGCANNHAFDYGEKPVSELIEFFQSNGIYYSGIGNSINDAASYTLIEENGVKIAFLSITDVYYAEATATEESAGVLTTAFQSYNTLINAASKEADMTIVYVHWGEENEISSNDEQEHMGHQMIDAGADIVIGSHPNVLQDVELYKDGIIFYSLGNFIFDQGNTYSKDSVMVRLVLDQNGNGSFKLIPIRISDGVPGVTDNAFYKARIYREMTQRLDASQYYYDTDGQVVIPVSAINDRILKNGLMIDPDESISTSTEDLIFNETEAQ